MSNPISGPTRDSRELRGRERSSANVKLDTESAPAPSMCRSATPSVAPVAVQSGGESNESVRVSSGVRASRDRASCSLPGVSVLVHAPRTIPDSATPNTRRRKLLIFIGPPEPAFGPCLCSASRGEAARLFSANPCDRVRRLRALGRASHECLRVHGGDAKPRAHREHPASLEP